MVWQFVDVFKRVKERINDDDFADRLSHRYTVALLILFMILNGSSSYVGSNINCWTPAQFTGPMNSYANAICWISSKYYVPMDEHLPTPLQDRETRINYYQWVPYILSFMAMCFFIPFCVWHFMAKPSGLDAKSVMKIIHSMDQSSPESRDKTMRNTVKLIDRAIDYHRDYYDATFLGNLRRRVSRCCLPNNRSGYYITALYIIVKLLYCFNVCIQFFLLNIFMGPGFNFYGFEVIRDLIKGKDFWESPRFPRIIMCDFDIRNLGENVHRTTLQCNVPVNLFNEKMFMIIWFWLFFVAFMSVYSFFYWFFTFTSGSRASFIRRYLKINDRIGYHHQTGSNTSSTSTIIDEKIFAAFLYEYLKQDGVFLLHIVKKNSNDIVVGELVCALWDNFKRYPRFAMQVQNDSMEKEKEHLVNGGDGVLGYHHMNHQ